MRYFLLSFAALFLARSAVYAADDSIITIQRDNSNKPLPKFSNGWTLFYEHNPPKVIAYDSDGRLKFESSFAMKGVKQLMIVDLAASVSGKVVICASVTSDSDEQRAAVLIWVNPSGTVEKVVRTSPFGASRVVFGPGDQVWALGLVRGTDGKSDQPHDVLRMYDQSGVLIKTALPRQGFAKNPVSGAIMITTNDRFGILSSPNQQYVEFDWSGKELGRWRFEFPANHRPDIIGAGLTSTGELVVANTGIAGKESVSYRFDRSNGQLIPSTHLSERDGVRYIQVLGSEGNRLVIYGHDVNSQKTAARVARISP